MKKTFIIGQHVKTNAMTGTQALGELVVEISDVAVDDWKHQTHKVTGKLLAQPRTINQVKAACGGSSQVTFVHPINQQRFTLDLSPWDHVDGNRYLRIDMGWVRKASI